MTDKTDKKGQNNRIEMLLQAMQQGRSQYEELMRRTQEAKAGPAFAVNEFYDIRGAAPLRKLPADRGGVQMHLGPTITGPEEAAADETGEGISAHGYEEIMDETCNRIAAGDNLEYMVWLLKEKKMAGRIQLIYIDPPFFTGVKYQASVQIDGRDGKKSPVLKVGAYEDSWGRDLGAYLRMLSVRFYVMRDLLADTGSIWVHLDWHGSHYVKMMLDEIFGPEHFINEVAWTYKSGGASKRSFARKHDTLLFYSKTGEYTFHHLKEKSYNRQFKPYRFKGVEEFEDETGWYTLVNMKDVWNIDMVGRTSGERMGYATQKPEKLLERIVDACTDPGDLCADFFAGTGTLGAVCSRKGRPWIMCDEGDAAIGTQILRMADLLAEMPEEDINKNVGEAAEEAERTAGGSITAGTGRRPFIVERKVLPYEVRPRASVRVVIRDGHLMLDRYQPDLTEVQQKDREIVSGYISENSLDLISFWSADLHCNGRFHAGRRLLPGHDIVPLPERSGEQKIPEGSIHLVGYDIFGGRFEWTSGRRGEPERQAGEKTK